MKSFQRPAPRPVRAFRFYGNLSELSRTARLLAALPMLDLLLVGDVATLAVTPPPTHRF